MIRPSLNFLQAWGLARISSGEFVDGLVGTGLVSRGSFGVLLHAKELVTAHMPDGRMVAADDPTGRLFRWAALRSTRPAAPDTALDPTTGQMSDLGS